MTRATLIKKWPLSISFRRCGCECPGGPAIIRGTISFETLAELKNFRILASASQRNWFVRGCKTQGVPRVRGHRNLKSMCCVNSRNNRRRVRTVSATANVSHMTLWRVLGTASVGRSGCTP
ncbi:hypothetical protein TNIN_73171 [Trichonephila inaurata madagascariensis]|uniref:Uncharacterized protein n=1 Tax=Trichonephila inaurata madagascariensis TaxID=2747483 RepID=A0A8X6XH72_9ARAC|nr:hypothetical protein TNIN_73171 [Trichonephila inaurata madagascariensis]